MNGNLQQNCSIDPPPKLRLIDGGSFGPPSLGAMEFAGVLASMVRAERDTVIVAQGDPTDYCYLVVTGCLRTVSLMDDGRRQVGEFLLAGDLFGWEALDEHAFALEAVTSVALRRYARRSLEAVADRDPDFTRWLANLSAKRLRAGQNRLLVLGRMTASERIAGCLLEMAARMSDESGTCIELPMSRTDIADYLGLTTETVCRGLTQMQRESIIDIDRALIVIRDRHALDARCGALGLAVRKTEAASATQLSRHWAGK